MRRRRLRATTALALTLAWVSPPRHWPRTGQGWSNGGVFVRVWEYEVPVDQAVVFTVANAPDGAWGQLFGRAAGFLGTELYRDCGGDRSRALDAHG